jgi:DNA invertase Pin-like site-specific DNA recombinase
MPGSLNKKTPEKHEKIKIFLQSGKNYDWIAKELSVSRQTISAIKKAM